MEYLGFEDLEVYTFIKEFCKDVYRLIEDFPPEERFALADQLRRSCISIGSNLAEGYGRFSFKEKVNFLGFANGSLYESFFQLNMAFEMGYISKEDFEKKRDEIYRISRMFFGLKQFYERTAK